MSLVSLPHFYPEGFDRLENPWKETKYFPSLNILSYLSSFYYCFHKNNSEKCHTFLDIDFLHVFAWSILMTSLFLLPVNKHLVSREIPCSKRTQIRKQHRQSVRWQVQKEVLTNRQGDIASVAQDKCCAWRPQHLSLQQQCTFISQLFLVAVLWFSTAEWSQIMKAAFILAKTKPEYSVYKCISYSPIANSLFSK